FMMFQTEATANDHVLLNWVMGILAPFTLFPAISALFNVVRKWVMGDSDVPILRTFFKGYKDNYKQSMIGGIFYTLLFVIMWVDYKVY
ncbi:YesL family protein, partial [Escherichia coli]|uniref:YesL family protein n=1 Tax=Escherichia coli TaxID=562 RepID=UPI00307A3673